MRPLSRASHALPASTCRRRELAPLAGELSHILGWIEQLGEVDTDDVAPMTSVVAMRLAWRDDTVTDGDKAEAILANAPARQGDWFVVPKVVE